MRRLSRPRHSNHGNRRKRGPLRRPSLFGVENTAIWQLMTNGGIARRGSAFKRVQLDISAPRIRAVLREYESGVNESISAA